jgi:hypothetical protein
MATIWGTADLRSFPLWSLLGLTLRLILRLLDLELAPIMPPTLTLSIAKVVDFLGVQLMLPCISPLDHRLDCVLINLGCSSKS